MRLQEFRTAELVGKRVLRAVCYRHNATLRINKKLDTIKSVRKGIVKLEDSIESFSLSGFQKQVSLMDNAVTSYIEVITPQEEKQIKALWAEKKKEAQALTAASDAVEHAWGKVINTKSSKELEELTKKLKSL